jgi:hypothetical protein
MQPLQVCYLLHDENISFENAALAANNAPAFIKTYEILLGYENLTAKQERLIRNQLASAINRLSLHISQ